MQEIDPSKGFFASIPQRVLLLTGFRLGDLLKAGAVLLVAIVGIRYVVLSTDADAENKSSNSGVVKSLGPTDEGKLRGVSQLPSDFSSLQPVERLGILNSKIAIAEDLAKSDGEFADPAIEQLIFLYGVRCNIEETEGMAPEQTYRKMAGLRQAAFSAGNSKRVGQLDFLRALAATARLSHRADRADFRFASDAILNLESENLVNVNEVTKLFLYALDVQKKSPDKASAEIYLSLLGDKFAGSPEPSIVNLGRSLKDYPKYVTFYEAAMELPDSSREARLKLYKDMFAAVEDSPPRSVATYKIIVQLTDRLVNRSEVDTARILIERISKSAENADPAIRVLVDESIENIKKRVAALGSKVDLTGSKHDGSPLQLPNSKPTTIVFWRPSVSASAEHVTNLAESNLYDQWNSNVLVVAQSELTDDHLKRVAKQISKFTIVDNATSKRLTKHFGIDLVPYQVAVDKNGVVLRLGAPTN